jgi:hypothetical protein
MIISILGISGRERETKEAVSMPYDCKVLEKTNGSFCNSTDVLLSNYDDDFYFICTQFAINFQKELVDFRDRKHQFIVATASSALCIWCIYICTCHNWCTCCLPFC